MTTPIKTLLHLLILFTLTTGACHSSSVAVELPDLGIPQNEINARIKLEAPRGWNTFKIGDIVGLTVDVISTDQIAFQHDYGAKIFLLDNAKWTEIPNIMNYPSGYLVLSPSKGDPFKQGTADVDPLVPNIIETVTVRIVLIGNIVQDGEISEMQTAGYVDLTLKP